MRVVASFGGCAVLLALRTRRAYHNRKNKKVDADSYGDRQTGGARSAKMRIDRVQQCG
jgi:hypothetical protein